MTRGSKFVGKGCWRTTPELTRKHYDRAVLLYQQLCLQQQAWSMRNAPTPKKKGGGQVDNSAKLQLEIQFQLLSEERFMAFVVYNLC